MTKSANVPESSAKSPVINQGSSHSSTKLAQKVADAIWDRKGFDVVALGVLDIVQYTDFIVICSATSDRHAIAIADNVEKMVHEQLADDPTSVEGRTYGRWILLDYGDVVVHVFHKPVREYYQLERLFADAPRLPLEPPAWVHEISPDSLLQQAFDYGDELWSSAALSAEQLQASDDGEDTDDAPADDATP